MLRLALRQVMLNRLQCQNSMAHSIPSQAISRTNEFHSSGASTISLSNLFVCFAHRANLTISHSHRHAASLLTKTVPIVYIEPSGEEKEVQAEVGKNLLDIAHENDIELEGTRLDVVMANVIGMTAGQWS